MENNKQGKDSFTRNWKQSLRDYLLFPLIVSILTIFVTRFLTIKSEQKSMVEILSSKMEINEENGTIEDTINEIADRYKNAIEESNKYKEEVERQNEVIKKLQSNGQMIPQVDFHSIEIIKDGKKIEDAIKNGWAVIDGNNYYSEYTVNRLLNNDIFLDNNGGILAYNSDGSKNYKETKVALEKTSVLRPGKRCTVYDGTSSNSFSMGSSTYNTGFTLKADGWYYEGTALFDLSERYSKISFDVGSINGGSQGDAVLRIYFRKTADDKMAFEQEFDLQGNISSKHIEIDLNCYYDMTIELDYIDDGVEYGFVNVVLEY